MAALAWVPPVGIAALSRRGPWLTLTLTALAVGVGAQRVFELDRSAVLLGEWWRVVTCHLVHYSSAHAFGDIAAFAVWGAIVEAFSRRLLVAVLGTAVFVVGLGVLLLCPGVGHYGGLSAIDVALATTLLAVLATSPRFRRIPGARFWVVLIALAHVSKAVYEIALGTAILAPDLGRGVALLPAAHLLGAAAGIFAWVRRGAPSDKRSAVRHTRHSRRLDAPEPDRNSAKSPLCLMNVVHLVTSPDINGKRDLGLTGGARALRLFDHGRRRPDGPARRSRSRRPLHAS